MGIYQPHIYLFLMTLLLSACSSMGIQELSIEKLEQKYATGASQFIEVDGMRVHYRDEGEGPTLLMLHGILASLHTWDGWVDNLKGEYRLIRLDLPGFGLTGPANFVYNRDNYLQFINHFLKALNIEKFTMVGNSLGGFFAWNYAIDYPQQVERLVLLDSAGYAQDVPFPMKLYTIPIAGEITTHITPRAAIAINIRDVYGDSDKVTDETIDRYYELQLRPGNRKAAKQLFEYAVTQAGSDAEGISTISMPTLIMWGGDDDWVPTQLTEYWRRDLPDAEIIIYPGVGHVPMEEIPDKSAADLNVFMKRDAH